MAPRLLVVGGGRMGTALIGGLVAAGWAAPTELAVTEPNPERRKELADEFPGMAVLDAPVAADGALLAVKPEVAETATRALGAAGTTRVLSIVAGLSSARLEAVLQPGDVVVRAMPNTPAVIGAGVSAMSGGDAATAADLEWAEGILSSVGTVVRVPERLLDAVTAVSGSGPAYLFLVAEALVDGGVAQGLTREMSRELVVGTLLGSSCLVAESGDEPSALRATVTSPGGTTAAAVRALEMKAVRSAFIEAVAAAAERSRQLGR